MEQATKDIQKQQASQRKKMADYYFSNVTNAEKLYSEIPTAF